jgi:deazaflavin-dependent oxidoreductase (nitroreductase family)
MDLQDGANVIANLTTIGRKTGQPRSVELRLIFYQGCFYATSSRIAGKQWCQNLIANPSVALSRNGERRSCIATQVTDEDLRRRVLTLRGSPLELNRVVFEIRPAA